MTAGEAPPSSPRACDKVIAAPPEDGDAPAHLEQIGHMLGRRLEAEPENVERGVAQLVLTAVELIRQTMERQALARVDELPEGQVERMGLALKRMDRRVGELCETFGLTREDITRDLARLARLL